MSEQDLSSATRSESATPLEESLRFCPYCATGFIPNPGDEHLGSCRGCKRAERFEDALGEIIALPEGAFKSAWIIAHGALSAERTQEGRR